MKGIKISYQDKNQNFDLKIDVSGAPIAGRLSRNGKPAAFMPKAPLHHRKIIPSVKRDAMMNPCSSTE